MHKFYSAEDWAKFAKDSPETIKYVAASSGTRAGDWERLQAILAAVPEIKFICLDVANGYSQFFVEFVAKVRGKFPEHTIMVSRSTCAVNILSTKTESVVTSTTFLC